MPTIRTGMPGSLPAVPGVDASPGSDGERRRSRRFPVAAEVHWHPANLRNHDSTEFGETINMSSSGVLFTTSHPLAVGSLIELSVSWPVALNGHCGLKLVVQGRIARSEARTAALHIERYEFRTRGAHPLPHCDGTGRGTGPRRFLTGTDRGS